MRKVFIMIALLGGCGDAGGFEPPEDPKAPDGWCKVYDCDTPAYISVECAEIETEDAYFERQEATWVSCRPHCIVDNGDTVSVYPHCVEDK